MRKTIHEPLGRLLFNQKIKITSKISEYGDKSKYHGHQTEKTAMNGLNTESQVSEAAK